MKKAILYTIIFAAIQMMVTPAVMAIAKLFTGKSVGLNDPTILIVCMTIASLLSVALFIAMKWFIPSRAYIRSRPWDVLIWTAIAACGAIIPSIWFQEQMPELPNFAEETLTSIMGSRWGYVTIGLLAPIAEEVVFRGAILRELLGWTHRHWVAIAISALLFALIHANPAQMPHALIIGMLLGWLYYRTDSIVPGLAYHWVNNSIAYAFYALYPDPSTKLIDILGSNLHVTAALGFSVLILVPALFQLNLRLKKA